jgi:chlorobactene glucosyltransferase
MLLYNTVIFAVLLFCLGMLCWNLAWFRTMPRKTSVPASAAPFISVLVPARNEAHRIGPCAESLASQLYPAFEVLVLDDQSEDATADVLRGLGYCESPGARLRLLRGTPLPLGWTGKGWACQQLADAARGEWLLFADADTEHDPAMLASTLAMAVETRADLLSSWPLLTTLTWSEKAVLPIMHLALVFYPHGLLQWLQADPARARRVPRAILRLLGAANGQFLLFRRAAYELIGGNAAVRSHLVEDVALGRAVAMRIGEGLRLVNCNGALVSRVRMYESLAEVWEGFTKNIRAVFEDSLPLYLAAGMGSLLTFFMPFIFVWFAHGLARWLILGQIAVIYLVRARLTLRFGTSWLGCLLHPLGQIVMTSIGLNSWRRSAGKGVTWKGRLYEVK